MTTFLDKFTAYLQAQDRSPHTVKAYRSDAAAFFDWLAAQLGRPVPPVEVIAFDVQKYRDHLVAEGRKPASVNRSLAALRVCFAWAVQTGQASTNPIAVAGLPTEPQTGTVRKPALSPRRDRPELPPNIERIRAKSLKNLWASGTLHGGCIKM